MGKYAGEGGEVRGDGKSWRRRGGKMREKVGKVEKWRKDLAERGKDGEKEVGEEGEERFSRMRETGRWKGE